VDEIDWECGREDGMTEKTDLVQTNATEFFLYPTDDGRIKVEVRLEGETVWLTQAGRPRFPISINMLRRSTMKASCRRGQLLRNT
jgi:hypothetical protein